MREPHTTNVFGVGVFLLVRRSAYLRSPGFEWLKLEATAVDHVVHDDSALLKSVQRFHM